MISAVQSRSEEKHLDESILEMLTKAPKKDWPPVDLITKLSEKFPQKDNAYVRSAIWRLLSLGSLSLTPRGHVKVPSKKGTTKATGIPG